MIKKEYRPIARLGLLRIIASFIGNTDVTNKKESIESIRRSGQWKSWRVKSVTKSVTPCNKIGREDFHRLNCVHHFLASYRISGFHMLHDYAESKLTISLRVRLWDLHFRVITIGLFLTQHRSSIKITNDASVPSSLITATIQSTQFLIY